MMAQAYSIHTLGRLYLYSKHTLAILMSKAISRLEGA